MLTITGKASHANLPEVRASLLEEGKFYSVAEYLITDEGVESMEIDVVLVGKGNKTAKVIRFLKGAKSKTLSEIPSVRFYGPFGIEPSECLE